LAPESTALTTSNRLFLRRLFNPCLSLCLLAAVPFASFAADSEVARKANSTGKNVAQQQANKPASKVRKVAKTKPVDTRPSFGRVAGLHQSGDALDLRSSVALVIDQDTHEVLLRKNDQAVLPIASLTKLMTGLVISDANLPHSEMIAITQEDVDTEKGSTSRLAVGSVLSRGDLLHLALMSSENRAAHALGRTYPGGLSAFVKAMNDRAQGLGMASTHYVEPLDCPAAINRVPPIWLCW